MITGRLLLISLLKVRNSHLTGKWLSLRRLNGFFNEARWLSVAIFLSVNGNAQVSSSESAQTVLEKHCAACHGSTRMSGLDVRDRSAILRGGTRGPAIVPGDAEHSLLYKAVLRTGELRMPPGKTGLSDTQVSAIRSWINSGARWDAKKTVANEPTWWAFKKVQKPAIPAAKDGQRVRNPIDSFIFAKLEGKHLRRAPPAEKVSLIRRAYFDLIGLPPRPDEVDHFVSDSSPDAYEKLIDELLSRPQYGERWGRHWLDVVRYADTGGYETDIYFRNAWRYRDYVIRSLNDDKPYDRFVQEQIAGDELWPDNLDLLGSYNIAAEKKSHLEARVATGLYAIGPEVHESNMDAKKLQYEKLTDWVDVTGAAFMGMTFGCARCHDHKFDPIAQRDYYRLQAIFSFSTEGDIPVVHRMAIRDHGQHFPRMIQVAESRTAYRLFEAKVKERVIASRKATFPADVVAAFEVPEPKRTSEQSQLAMPLVSTIRDIKLDKEFTPEEAKQRDELLAQIGKGVLAIPEQSAQEGPWDAVMDIPSATVLVHREAELVPPTYIYPRGDLELGKEKVSAGLPSFLGGRDILTDDCSGRCIPLARKQLALWLTNPEHPLTARVMVNRIWQGHFGRGIVATPNDFGRQGQQPSHAELLDWLAADFMEYGWSIKRMHRQIMLSETYRMSSTFQNEENLRIDPENRLLWRMNRRRLEGEILWDAMHAVAGTLNLKLGGRPVVPPLSKDELSALGAAWQWPVSADPADQRRRGVYMLVRRNFNYPMFDAFDSPNSAVSCPERDVSSIAPQALWFMNSGPAYEQAKEFASRLKKDYADDPKAQVTGAWRLAFATSPTKNQIDQAAHLVETLSLEKFCLALFNLNEFSYVD